ncbi:hypothetical protein C8J56DRAFT_123659 [Mycena floridula]|nr:hypothetical protein C8J56DRAFT_123659 [Mycena floridula]
MNILSFPSLCSLTSISFWMSSLMSLSSVTFRAAHCPHHEGKKRVNIELCWDSILQLFQMCRLTMATVDGATTAVVS